MQFQDAKVFNLLEEDLYLQFISNPKLFRNLCIQHHQNNGGRLFVIDEVQRLPFLLNEVHNLIENQGFIFILSGSSARKLKRAGANLLAGRALENFLFPLTYQEIIRSQQEFDLDSILQFGALPKVFLSDELDKKAILKSYVNTYLAEEIQQEGGVRNLPAFIRFLELAAESNSQELNYSQIASDSGVRSSTIKEYYSILSETRIGTLLYPWTKSVRKELAGSPKFYFFDQGIVNALQQKLSSNLSNSEKGPLFEQWVINQVIAYIHYHQLERSLNYWKTKAGVEVDLLVSKSRKPIAAIEIKWTSKPTIAHFSGLKSILEEHPNINGVLVCNVMAPEKHEIRGRIIEVLPYSDFMKNMSQYLE
jgi:predicted AAA+ superfamily ATPase